MDQSRCGWNLTSSLHCRIIRPMAVTNKAETCRFYNLIANSFDHARTVFDLADDSDFAYYGKRVTHALNKRHDV